MSVSTGAPRVAGRGRESPSSPLLLTAAPASRPATFQSRFDGRRRRRRHAQSDEEHPCRTVDRLLPLHRLVVAGDTHDRLQVDDRRSLTDRLARRGRRRGRGQRVAVYSSAATAPHTRSGRQRHPRRGPSAPSRRGPHPGEPASAGPGWSGKTEPTARVRYRAPTIDPVTSAPDQHLRPVCTRPQAPAGI